MYFILFRTISRIRNRNYRSWDPSRRRLTRRLSRLQVKTSAINKSIYVRTWRACNTSCHVVVAIYRHYRLEAALSEINWRVKWDDIMFGAPERRKLERTNSKYSISRVSGHSEGSLTSYRIIACFRVAEIKRKPCLWLAPEHSVGSAK